jgi:hypothetical protein
MLRKQFQRSLNVHDHTQMSELGLVRDRLDDASSREAVHKERGHPEADQLLKPALLASPRAIRSVHEHNGWKGTGAGRLSPYPGNMCGPTLERRLGIAYRSAGCRRNGLQFSQRSCGQSCNMRF